MFNPKSPFDLSEDEMDEMIREAFPKLDYSRDEKITVSMIDLAIIGAVAGGVGGYYLGSEIGGHLGQDDQRIGHHRRRLGHRQGGRHRLCPRGQARCVRLTRWRIRHRHREAGQPLHHPRAAAARFRERPDRGGPPDPVPGTVEAGR